MPDENLNEIPNEIAAAAGVATFSDRDHEAIIEIVGAIDTARTKNGGRIDSESTTTRRFCAGNVTCYTLDLSDGDRIVIAISSKSTNLIVVQIKDQTPTVIEREYRRPSTFVFSSTAFASLLSSVVDEVAALCRDVVAGASSEELEKIIDDAHTKAMLLRTAAGEFFHGFLGYDLACEQINHGLNSLYLHRQTGSGGVVGWVLRVFDVEASTYHAVRVSGITTEDPIAGPWVTTARDVERLEAHFQAVAAAADRPGGGAIRTGP